jgi:MFS family permease
LLALCHAHAIASLHVVNILVDPIKASLALSDTQFSLLQGAAVAILAGVLGLPAARLADRGNRRNVILLGVAVWSAGSAASAFALDFVSLFASRAMVGVGEIVLFPAALSMIYDLAPRHRLATSIGVFGAGGPFGAAIALAGGGWLAANGGDIQSQAPWLSNLEPWRLAFLLLAALGALLAVAMLFAPDRRRAVGEKRAEAGEAMIQLRRAWRAYAGVMGGFILLSIAVLAINAWAPTYLIRARGFDAESAGRLAGFAAIACAMAGAWLAGAATDALQRRGRADGALILGMLFALLLAVSVVGLATAHSAATLAGWLCLAYALMSTPTVLGGTALQQISPPHLRARIMALHVLLVNVIALTAGPTGVALIIDRVFGEPDAVGWSLAIVVALATVPSVIAFAACRRSFLAAREDAADRRSGALRPAAPFDEDKG